MTNVIIIQARMGSSRLPGKVMMELAGRTVLSHVVERCLRVDSADAVCVATTYKEIDNTVAAEAAKNGAQVFRGSESDVLSRYFEAAKWLNASTVLRVTSDCPFVDPDLCDQTLRLHQAQANQLTTNNQPPSWPHGVECEVFSFEMLEAANRIATSPYEREHVSPWIHSQPNIARNNILCPDSEMENLRLTLDYPVDFEFMTKLFQYLPANTNSNWRDIYSVIQNNPSLQDINTGFNRA